MNKDSVFLVAGGLLCVLDGFPESWREDVLNTLLFSQLYASSEENKFSSTEQWHARYISAMGMAKWSRPVYRSDSFEPDKDEVVVLKDLLRKKILDVLGDNQIEPLERMIGCIEQSPDPLVVWAMLKEHAVATVQTEEASEVSTIVLQVRLLGAGPVVYSVFACFSTTEEVEVDFFNQRFVGSHIVGKVSLDVSLHVLDKVSYKRSKVREKILDELPDTKNELVLDLSSECSCLLE
ncbi:hypothetical protein C1886_15695 [Pseudomonas sp. FW300-N1A1]|uniref:hypothetical protein n=1 Tax=Pseudomonas sp. FW300-N1A1 TaxID=2075555 RepID=UPI000CD2CEA4|nr:hypothetical protein [Pseudomonas sp. FW300-N1A1]POA18666.1 hypothetical protein C1886_15695 [Pseudomonas sp. FW300-N1A1]